MFERGAEVEGMSKLVAEEEAVARMEEAANYYHIWTHHP